MRRSFNNLGDFNIDPSDSPILVDAISKGFLLDLGENCGPTFLPSHGQPRRLDLILAARSAATTLLTANNVESSGLPGHLPIAAEFRLTELNEITPRIRKPASFPTNMPHQPKLSESILAKAGDLNFEDVNQAYNSPGLLRNICSRLQMLLVRDFLVVVRYPL